jgi:periplasmic divalent cation tolerance protein
MNDTFVCFEVTTTVENSEDAAKLSRLVVEQRLGACVQVIPCQSTYHWQGRIEEAEEWKVMIKTSVQLLAELEKLLVKHHPYDLPEILALPVYWCNSAYLAWMKNELKRG